MEKQIFETPEMEMVEITVNDVIATSGEYDYFQGLPSGDPLPFGEAE
ncbi:MAG: hypothetical protein MJZ34_14305 [Paludibacteraceae bacterium]|mgnify:FL=1|nr:hypothetical protein [Paludibacteraceae bacterium]MCQ2211454.1 hypothetical protein [Paludibacteraceae bacterium]